MVDVIKEIDEQMRKWVSELDALYKNRDGIDGSIQKLEGDIEIIKKSKEVLGSVIE